MENWCISFLAFLEILLVFIDDCLKIKIKYERKPIFKAFEGKAEAE